MLTSRSPGPHDHRRVPVEIHSVLALLDDFDLFLFDQYGVLHDGREPYPGMASTLGALKRAGRQVGVITNSGRDAAHNASRLAAFGFGADRVDRVLSSGELSQRELGALPAGSRLYVVARAAAREVLSGMPLLEVVTDATSADLVLIAGCSPEAFSLDDYMSALGPAAARSVPALCTNPDLLMLVDGGIRFGAGEVAATYAALGAPVRTIGKPFPELYAALLDDAGVSAARTLCIGDSIAHDILGANRAGCASLLVASGVHAHCSDAELAALCAEHAAWPDYVLPRRRSS